MTDAVSLTAANKPGSLKGWRLLAAMLLVKVGAAAISFVSTQGSLKVTILDKMMAPGKCSRLLGGRMQGDGGTMRYCSVVFTNYGLFSLIPPNSLNPLALRPKEMAAMWHVGCSYQISYSGIGDLPQHGMLRSNGKHKVIYWSQDLHHCTPWPDASK